MTNSQINRCFTTLIGAIALTGLSVMGFLFFHSRAEPSRRDLGQEMSSLSVETPCPECQGTGKCPGCNGSGIIEHDEKQLDTLTQLGLFRLGLSPRQARELGLLKKTEKCDLCGGSGVCPSCNGKGTLKTAVHP